MSPVEEVFGHLAAVPELSVERGAPLAPHTRFDIGGPAAVLVRTRNDRAFLAALDIARTSGLPFIFFGDGTNLVVSDQGFPGVVLKYTADGISAEGLLVRVDAGAVLQRLVDFTIGRDLKGLETLAGIPGWVGAAIYGNAGAYGHSISERVREVRAYDGRELRVFSNAECRFRYRDSVFKRRKDAIIFSAVLEMLPGDHAELQRTAGDILQTRNEKFPPTMKCAGSVFKNILFDALPEPARVGVPVREGKVPAAWFLEQVGAKGLSRGAIRVADYHANLVYNTGGGSAVDLRAVIQEMKGRVRRRFGFTLEEEVQYVGFKDKSTMALGQIEATPKILREMLAGVSGEEGAVKPTPSSFSVAEAVTHLVHVERHCYESRVEKILCEDNPAIPAYDPKSYQAAGAYSGMTLAAAMEAFSRARAENLARLSRLAADQFARTGMHEAVGRFTLGEMVNEWAAHDLGHVRQIANILREIRYVPAMGPFGE